MAAPDEAEREVLGRVASVNPAKREARVKVAAGLVLDVSAISWAWFGGGGAETRYKVAEAQASEGELRLRLAAGVPMDAVRALQGAMASVVVAAVASRGPLWRQARAMVGCVAVDVDGARVGTVAEAYGGAKSAAIKVESDQGTAWVLPVVEGVVLALDRERGAVVLGDYTAFEDTEDGDAD